MSNVLHQQHRNVKTASDMLYNIHEIFGDQGRQAKYQAVLAFKDCRMKLDTLVRDHMLAKIGHLNEMKMMGAKIDEKTQVDMILASLSETFDDFILIYYMNNLSYSLTELMKELQYAETLLLKGNKRKYGETYYMLYNIQKRFGDQGCQAKQQVVCAFMNCRMKPDTLVLDHMLAIIGHLNEMKMMGVEIDEKTQVDMILETLPETFNIFKLIYSMNKLNYSFTELMNNLQFVETLLPKGNKRKFGETHVEYKPFSSSSKKSGRNSKRAKKVGSGFNKDKRDAKGKTKVSVNKSEDKCHHCQKIGHWKRNCPTYLEEVKGKSIVTCNSSLFYDYFKILLDY